MANIFDKILITGSCGTIGSGLVEFLSQNHPKSQIICIDNNESSLFFQEQQYIDKPNISFNLADVRDVQSISAAMRDVTLVFHTAALKHVVMCERSPMEAVNTNIEGVNNLCRAAIDAKVKKVVFTSSDKAVNPTNVMGTSKLMGERLVTAANTFNGANDTVFTSTRFGNVLGSNGSVIPIFRKQIEKGGPVTLTDEEMSRFVMSKEQAVRLVVDSAKISKGGEVFITKMPSIMITDLAQVMIEELAPKYGHDPSSIEITKIGSKPGEKLYEELMSLEETRRAVELHNYFAVLPAFRGLYRDIDYKFDDIVTEEVNNPYISRDEEPMSKEELRDFLVQYDLLSTVEKEEPDQRYWPGDKS